jgi:hypothetical protein
LVVLGEALNIDLELEAQERAVGPFRADILCKDIDTDRWVLIENQLEPTHLALTPSPLFGSPLALLKSIGPRRTG